MEQPISAAEANRQFSAVLRSVRDGNSYVVTSHGKPVARIVPTARHEAVMVTARATLLKRLAQQKIVDVGPWSRDDLYAVDA